MNMMDNYSSCLAWMGTCLREPQATIDLEIKGHSGYIELNLLTEHQI